MVLMKGNEILTEIIAEGVEKDGELKLISGLLTI